MRCFIMKIGNIVKGEITAIKPYGAFVKVDKNHVGLVHISQISDNYVRNIEDYLAVGDVVTLKVIDVHQDKLSLSFKALHKRKKRYKIQLKSGFAPLQENLENWVSNYSFKDGE